MHLTKRFLVFLLASAAWAQAPTWDQYLSGLAAAMQQVRDAVAVTPHHAMLMSAQHMPLNVNWITNGKATCDPSAAQGTANACTYNNLTVINAYTDALYRAGVRALDLNFDAVVLRSSSQYAGSLSNDCPNGWNCKTLANYDAGIAHAVGLGMKIHLRPKPDDYITPCGLDASTTEAQLEACASPLYVAAAVRWASSLDSLTVIHEAFGGFGSNVPFQSLCCTGTVAGVTYIDTFVKNVAAAIRTAAPRVKLGATAETMYAPDANYFNDYVTIPVLDFVGVDLYNSDCSVNNYYSTAVATAASWAALAKSNGKELRIEESARPRWLPTSCGTGLGDNNAVEGAGDIDYLTSSTDAVWLGGIVPYLSAQGYSVFSMYPAEVLIWATPNHASDSTVTTTGYTSDILSHLSDPLNANALTWIQLMNWRNVCLEGRAHLSGRASLR